MSESKAHSHAPGEREQQGSRDQLLAGRYLVMRQLGHGGMGTVWLAADQLLGRQVAIKELRPPAGLSGAELQTHQWRVLQEARSAARIQHPNAVTLHEIIPAATPDGPAYLIMEFVDGPTLSELIARDGALPASRVARYGLQMLDVLAAAHALGIVHRDVKPDNIMIAAGDQAKLSDFGIAHVAGDPRLTRSGVMGTQAYVAPELFDGAPIMPAADLWSLGATLFHAADGRGAFNRASTSATLRAVIFDDVPVPLCDPRLAAAIAGLLKRDPRERATIEQARASLREMDAPAGIDVPAGSPAPPPETPAEEPRNRLPRSHHVAVAVAAVVSLLVAAGVAVGTLLTHPHPGSPRPVPSVTHPRAAAAGGGTAAGGGIATPPAASITSGILTLRATITGSHNAAQDEITYSPDGTMLVTYGAQSSSDAIVRSAATGAVIADLPFGPGVSDVAFSPDSQTVAAAGDHGGVGLWNVADHKATYPLAGTSSATGVAFSPDGSTLAVADGSGIQMLDVATGTWGTTLKAPAGASGLRTVLFTPSGDTLAAADSTTGNVYVWDVSTGALIGTIAAPANDPPGLGTWIGYSTTTGLLAIGSSGDGNTFPGVRFWAIQSRSLVSSLKYPGVGGVNGIAYDPADGAFLAVVGTNGKVFVWEMPAGKEFADPLDPGGTPIADVAFSPDSKTLAVLDTNDHIFLWSVTGAGSGSG